MNPPSILKRVRNAVRKTCCVFEVARTDPLERQIIQSYVWVLREPETADGQRTCTLARHGVYEVRLLEPSLMPQGDTIPFWIELFDHDRKLTLDSVGKDDVEEAAFYANALIKQAELLHRTRP
jgi:hypothetical protein